MLSRLGDAFFKIGHTCVSVESRLASLQTGCPLRLTLMATVSGARITPAIEKAVHNLLAEVRVQGEWFKTSMSQDVLQSLVAQAMRFILAASIPVPGAIDHGHRRFLCHCQ